MFIVETAFLCLFVAKMYWHQRRSMKLWALLALLLITHVGGYVALLIHVPNFPSALFLLAVPFEIALVATVVKICLNIMPRKAKL